MEPLGHDGRSSRVLRCSEAHVIRGFWYECEDIEIRSGVCLGTQNDGAFGVDWE